MTSLKKPIIIVILVLILDQILKFWVKTNMFMGESISIFGNWFLLHFTENNGMAFGIEFGGEYGKMALSVFRIFAIFAICWYAVLLAKKKAPEGLIISIALIIAGAVGNIIDSAFYGMLFSESTNRIAEFLPHDGGYSSFLHGRVVDMLHFPIIRGHFPDWFPFWANESFEFFRPIFNIADSSITIGFAIILIFHRKYFHTENIENQNYNNEQCITNEGCEGGKKQS